MIWPKIKGNKMYYVAGFLIIVIIAAFFLYTNLKYIGQEKTLSSLKTNNGICITKLKDKILYTTFCPAEVKSIPMNISLKNSTEIYRYYNYTLILFNPHGRGNYTVAVLNLLLALPKRRVIPVCISYDPNCPLYLVNIANGTIKFAPTQQNQYYTIYYEINATNAFIVNVSLSNTTGIFQITNNTVYILGTNDTIRKAINRFIFWWYGVN